MPQPARQAFPAAVVSTGSSSEGCRRTGRCRACTVRANALFVDLPLDELDRIAPSVPDLVVPAGQRLYDGGDWPNALFIVRRGVVKLEQYLPDGSYRIVRLARRTDILALESLLETACDHTAVALTEVEVCRVPLPVVRLVMEKQAWLAERMIHHWHRAVRNADVWLTHYATGSARQRMARLLGDLHDLETAALPPNSGRPAVELPSRDDVGAILGITKETASRLVADFRRAGLLVNVGPRHVRVDRAGLAAIADIDG